MNRQTLTFASELVAEQMQRSMELASEDTGGEVAVSGVYVASPQRWAFDVVTDEKGVDVPKPTARDMYDDAVDDGDEQDDE